MSYKHNNLMAMRQNYWNDKLSSQVQQEKVFLQTTLMQQGVFSSATLEDAKYLFFSLPSIIIVKGYALGFMHETVQNLIHQHIQTNKQQLQQRSELKIQFQMS
ncbi:hypothetical protein [Acinetobacter variabilis]|uniref:hypothetical protein n=1 Tax=Acinetobacter variabilis TaxID=70346 RepID=UPI001BB626CB|nr:hypothetical protein [Acinetobacter variabilis]BCT89059.1 hypothetical protein RYU24_14640 [Acinetobacter variabilis]